MLTHRGAAKFHSRTRRRISTRSQFNLAKKKVKYFYLKIDYFEHSKNICKCPFLSPDLPMNKTQVLFSSPSSFFFSSFLYCSLPSCQQACVSSTLSLSLPLLSHLSLSLSPSISFCVSLSSSLGVTLAEATGSGRHLQDYFLFVKEDKPNFELCKSAKCLYTLGSSSGFFPYIPLGRFLCFTGRRIFLMLFFREFSFPRLQIIFMNEFVELISCSWKFSLSRLAFLSLSLSFFIFLHTHFLWSS